MGNFLRFCNQNRMILLGAAVLLLYAGKLPAWEVSNADKYGKGFGIYQSMPANKLTKRPRDNRDQAGKLAHNPAYFDDSNVDFRCPGYSVMTGITSRYKHFDSDVDDRHHSSDRTFAFRCSFLEDPEDQLLIKHNCRNKREPSDHQLYKPGSSSCHNEGRFIHGLISEKSRKGSPTAKPEFFRDRINKALCCHLQDIKGNQILPTNECTRIEFPAGKSFSFQCNEGYLITKIESKYDQQAQDRSHTFYCCKARAAPAGE